MRSCKFKLKVFLFLSLLNPLYAFDDNKCFNDSFEVEVLHKGQPFGLLPVKLHIKKAGCNLTVQHEKLKYIKKAWQIDICREPVHIKKGLGAVEVLKKTAPCEGKERGQFCTEFLTMKKLIQDDGLIFAEGEKENLGTDHGKTYCSYLLLNRYLEMSMVFNRGQDYQGRLIKEYQSSGAEIEIVKETNETTIGSKESTIPVPEMIEGDSTPSDESEEKEFEVPKTEPVSEKKAGEGYF